MGINCHVTGQQQQATSSGHSLLYQACCETSQLVLQTACLSLRYEQRFCWNIRTDGSLMGSTTAQCVGVCVCVCTVCVCVYSNSV